MLLGILVTQVSCGHIGASPSLALPAMTIQEGITCVKGVHHVRVMVDGFEAFAFTDENGLGSIETRSLTVRCNRAPLRSVHKAEPRHHEVRLKDISLEGLPNDRAPKDWTALIPAALLWRQHFPDLNIARSPEHCDDGICDYRFRLGVITVDEHTGQIRGVHVELKTVDTGVDPNEDDGYVYHPRHDWYFTSVSTVKSARDCRTPDPPPCISRDWREEHTD